MSSDGNPADRARVTVWVTVSPAEAFRTFTDEIDEWWRRGSKYRVSGKHRGILHIEPRVGGRLFESFESEGGTRVVQTGTVVVWQPPERLAFEWRAVNFAPGETTRVEVEFAASSSGTLVTLTHSGWSRVRADHPARHGLDVPAFLRMMGLWWGELLSALRVHAATREPAAAATGAATQVYRNPVVPGFHPDPSVCRVGRDYYLATSTFEYFPAVPIFHSRDLVHWRQIGHALTRPSQAPLANTKSSKGIFAPTLRHHDGTFYLVTTNIDGGGSFYVTTRDPAGEWSEPVWIQESSWGMDPSLFFDDDGRVYYTRHGGGERGGIYQAEIDLTVGKLFDEPRLIWSGTGDVWPEGPHLFKVQGTYFLFIAEGGTGHRHAVTVARSPSPWGPFEACPRNPILTHRHREGHAIQATGHGDIVRSDDGNYWMTLLGVRPSDGTHHHLGRETFLAPLTWDADGWPSVNAGLGVELEMPATGLALIAHAPATGVRDEFDAPELGLTWVSLRGPASPAVSLTARPGWLRLSGSAASLDEVGVPAFVGRRQQHFDCVFGALLEFTPSRAEHEAGLTVRANEDNHYDLFVTRAGARSVVRVRLRVDGQSLIVAELERELDGAPLLLEVRADRHVYRFFAGTRDSAPRALAEAPTAALSSERAGGFTGVVLALYATSGGADPAPPADFDWCEYRPGQR